MVVTCFIFFVGCTGKGVAVRKETTKIVDSTIEAKPVIVPEPTKDPGYEFTVSFAWDINFDEDWATMRFYNTQENGIEDCISEELIATLRESDIACLNNEFTYSNRGTPLPGKLYTFRANPNRVEILKELGIDVVKLANNHVYDYGEDALLDTLEVLEDAEISYMGAGRNLEEAMSPVYIDVDGKKIAFVAASRAEKYKMTPQATEDSPGILRCYDTTLVKETIKKAKAKADFVVAYIHWGTEYSDKLEKVQRSSAKEYIDAGADVIIGAHSHCLQGMEYYKGKPVIYSLGNFWFNEKTLDTMLVKLYFTGNEEEEKQRIFTYLDQISVNTKIDENGFLQEVR